MTTAPTVTTAWRQPATTAVDMPRRDGSGLPAVTLPPNFQRPTHHETRTAEPETHAAVQNAPRPAARTERPQAATTQAKEPKRHWFDRHGPKIAMYAAVGLCASGEYALAQLAGFPGPIAALLPIAMDVYVIQAMRRRRDVAAALLLSVLANALDRLAEARLFGVDRHGTATWWLIVAVVAIAPFIVWRVHRITETKTTKQRESTGTETRSRETATQVSRTETTSQTGETETRETSETETETETETSPAPQVPRRETGETTPRETTRETETKQPVSRRETRSPRPAQTPVKRETTTPAVTAIGDRETETTRLLDLMKARGGPMEVSLDDAISETGRPKSTAAKRLAAARKQYAKSA